MTENVILASFLNENVVLASFLNILLFLAFQIIQESVNSISNKEKSLDCCGLYARFSSICTLFLRTSQSCGGTWYTSSSFKRIMLKYISIMSLWQYKNDLWWRLLPECQIYYSSLLSQIAQCRDIVI